MCYDLPSSVYSAMASSCPPVTSSGKPLVCSPLTNGYSVQVGNGPVVPVYPVLVDCVPEVPDAISLGGLVLLALALAFGMRLLLRAI